MPNLGKYLRLCPLLCNRSAETNIYIYGPNKKTDQSSRKKIQLSNEEIANLPHAEFKALVIRVLTEMVEYGRKIDKRMKAMKSELKENVQGIVKGRKPGLKSMVWSRRKK